MAFAKGGRWFLLLIDLLWTSSAASAIYGVARSLGVVVRIGERLVVWSGRPLAFRCLQLSDVSSAHLSSEGDLNDRRTSLRFETRRGAVVIEGVISDGANRRLSRLVSEVSDRTDFRGVAVHRSR
jgi:hypothetical protein